MTNRKPTGDAADTSKASPPAADVALIHGVTPDGEGFQIVRARENRLEIGAVRPLREGAPITGEVVKLSPRPNFPALCDVETLYEPAARADRQEPAARLESERSGPAQVATDEYRRNWDAIWSRPADKSKLAN